MYRAYYYCCRASRSAFAHTSSALQRFEEPLRAVQAGRDSFHDSSAAHLPGSVVDNLPVRLLLLPLFFFRCSLQPQPHVHVTPLAAPASVRPLGARPQP